MPAAISFCARASRRAVPKSSSAIVVLARKDSDLAFVGHFKSDVHDAFLSVVNLSAVADGNNSDRSGLLNEDNAAASLSEKPKTIFATVKSLRPSSATALPRSSAALSLKGRGAVMDLHNIANFRSTHAARCVLIRFASCGLSFRRAIFTS
jgi:hypothetical protein